MTALAVWPSNMPPLQMEGYTLTPVDLRQKAQEGLGGSYALRINGDECEVACRLVLAATQAAWFEAFERDTLAQGSTWFKMPLWAAGQIAQQTVRFKSRPQATPIGAGHTAYEFVLVLRERAGMLPADLTEYFLANDPHLLARVNLDIEGFPLLAFHPIRVQFNCGDYPSSAAGCAI